MAKYIDNLLSLRKQLRASQIKQAACGIRWIKRAALKQPALKQPACEKKAARFSKSSLLFKKQPAFQKAARFSKSSPLFKKQPADAAHFIDIYGCSRILVATQSSKQRVQ